MYSHTEKNQLGKKYISISLTQAYIILTICQTCIRKMLISQNQIFLYFYIPLYGIIPEDKQST